MNFLFELMLVAKPLDEAEIEKVISNVKNIVDKNFGIIKRVQYLGHKRLTYTIKNSVEGICTVIELKATSRCAREIQRKLRYDDSVLRHMMVRKS